MFQYHCLNPIAEKGLGLFDEEYKKSEDLQECDAVLVRSAKMHDMELPESVKVIARAGAGVNNIPLDKCADKGIVVFNTPGANANAVKEQVLAAMLLASRDLIGGNQWVAENKDNADIAKATEKAKKAFAGQELKGKKLGVIGLGAIGQLVANAAIALGMDVYGYDPYLSVNAAWNLSSKVTHIVNVEDIYKECNYITIHVPALDSTKGMINKAAFDLMQDGTIIVNCARDVLVDETAIGEALKSGRVKKYVTDFPNDAVIGKEGVIATPHLGASSAEAEDNCAVMAADEIMDYLENGNIVNSVNMPACTLGPKKGTRIAVISKADAGALEKVAAIADGDVINKTRGDYAYTLAETSGDVDAAALEGEGIIRVRILK